MNCSDIRKKIPEHIEGTNSSSEQALIEEHLRSCEQCRLYAIEIRKTIETLQGLEEIEPPAWLTEKVMKKIRAEVQPKKSWIERLFFPLHIKLPIEAFAALLITVAAVIIYKNMGPELRLMEVQPAAPIVKSMPAEPGKKAQKDAMPKPQLLREEPKEARPADRAFNRETRDIPLLKEEKPVGQSAPAVAPTMPAPSSSFAPSPALAPAARQLEAGKASGMAARDEMMQRAAPTAPHARLSAEKMSDGLVNVTLSVRALDAAKKEIETYVIGVNGAMKTLQASETRIIMTVNLDPAKAEKFLLHLSSLGRIKEDLQTFSLQSGLFKIVIEQQ